MAPTAPPTNPLKITLITKFKQSIQTIPSLPEPNHPFRPLTPAMTIIAPLPAPPQHPAMTSSESVDGTRAAVRVRAAMRAGVCALLALVALLPRAFTTFAGVTYCPRRREVSPCTCLWGVDSPATLQLFCEKVGSYKEVFAALGGRFPPGTPAHISVAHSNVTDLNEAEVRIADLGLQVSKLMLNYNNLRQGFSRSFCAFVFFFCRCCVCLLCSSNVGC